VIRKKGIQSVLSGLGKIQRREYTRLHSSAAAAASIIGGRDLTVFLAAARFGTTVPNVRRYELREKEKGRSLSMTNEELLDLYKKIYEFDRTIQIEHTEPLPLPRVISQPIEPIDKTPISSIQRLRDARFVRKRQKMRITSKLISVMFSVRLVTAAASTYYANRAWKPRRASVEYNVDRYKLNLFIKSEVRAGRSLERSDEEMQLLNDDINWVLRELNRPQKTLKISPRHPGNVCTPRNEILSIGKSNRYGTVSH